MSDDTRSAVAVESEPHVRIEETFDAPRERVFDAWIRPDLLERWYAPRGCTFHIERMDVRSGGGYHWCIRNPAFGDCWTIGTYVEIVRPERLVFTAVIADASGSPATPESQGHDPAWPTETVVTVTFTERGARTVVTLEQSVSEALAKRTGAHPSWLEMFARLKDQLAGEQSYGDRDEGQRSLRPEGTNSHVTEHRDRQHLPGRFPQKRSRADPVLPD